jgi:2-oxo-3-hexenedioate decarboxylase
VDDVTLAGIADALIDAYDGAHMLAPITLAHPDFDVPAGYEVLHRIESRRQAQGWQPLGRKIGFTNRMIWPRYGVYQPMWAHVWTRTVHRTQDLRATLPLAGLVQPRIEPEVVFGLSGPVPTEGSARAILECVEWIAPGFEIVQSHFPDWKFSAADCTAAFGLHGALLVGPAARLAAPRRDALAAMLPSFELSLSNGDTVVDRGRGSYVLDSPALALLHLARVLSGQPRFPALAAGEIVTTGTVTDAWPVQPGQTWRSDYGALGIPGLELSFE